MMISLLMLSLIHTSEAFYTPTRTLQINPTITKVSHDLVLHATKTKGKDLQERVFNTMKSAGFENYSMQMSPKRFLLIFCGMVLFKYIRAKKLKQNFMEKQPGMFLYSIFYLRGN